MAKQASKSKAGGRPKKYHGGQITLRITEEGKSLLEAHAKRLKVSTAELARRMLEAQVINLEMLRENDFKESPKNIEEVEAEFGRFVLRVAQGYLKFLREHEFDKKQ